MKKLHSQAELNMLTSDKEWQYFLNLSTVSDLDSEPAQTQAQA